MMPTHLLTGSCYREHYFQGGLIMYENIFDQISNAAEKRNLKESTIRQYSYAVSYFLRCTNKPVSELTPDDVDAFLTRKHLEGISARTYNQYYAAIRFFYKKILKMNWDEDDLPYMKEDRSLPAVLTRQEINAIINVTENLKHKAMIALMYSAGLRLSEVIHLHCKDIRSSDMTVHVRETKSRVDRYTILSDHALEILNQYWLQCGRPSDILFPSSWTGSYLNPGGVNLFFKASAKKAGITRRVSCHACRHSFASHLYEDGTDIRYIQALLGHIDPKSTEVYIHISNKRLLGVRSPYDQGGAS